MYSRIGSARLNGLDQELSYERCLRGSPIAGRSSEMLSTIESMGACNSPPNARKQALPTRFTGCDYEFNSLSFLPTAPGPKLI